MDEFQAASVSAAFRQEFPDSLLWVDPKSSTGILVGRRKKESLPIGGVWPGLDRDRPGRSLSPMEIRNACSLSPDELREFAAPGVVVTDDNQLLAYNWTILPGLANFQDRARANLERIRAIAQQGAKPQQIRVSTRAGYNERTRFAIPGTTSSKSVATANDVRAAAIDSTGS